MARAEHSALDELLPLPHDLEAEEAVLGSILKDPSCLARVREVIEPEDFYAERNKLVYEAIVAAPKVDIRLIVDHQRRHGTLERAGGAEYLSTIDFHTPSAASVDRYIEIVQRTAFERHLADLGQALSDIAYHDQARDAASALDAAETLFARLRKRIRSSSWAEPEDRGYAQRSALGEQEYVEDLVRPGRVLVWAGPEGSGKSTSCRELQLRMATCGGTFAETWKILERGAVLLLSEMHSDDDFDLEARLLRALEVSRDALVGRYFRLPLRGAEGGGADLASAAWRERTVAWCQEHLVRLLAIDTGTNATTTAPWGADFQILFRDVRRMLEVYPALAIIVIVHTRKPQQGHRKSSALTLVDTIGEWGRWADVVLMQDEDGPDRSRLASFKRVHQQRKITARRQDGLLVEAKAISAAREKAARDDGDRDDQVLTANRARALQALRGAQERLGEAIVSYAEWQAESKIGQRLADSTFKGARRWLVDRGYVVHQAGQYVVAELGETALRERAQQLALEGRNGPV